jgi:glutamyl-tRNA reductase
VENVFLYNMDHLEQLMRENVRLREQEVARCREIIEEHTVALMAKLNGASESRRRHRLNLQYGLGLPKFHGWLCKVISIF